MRIKKSKVAEVTEFNAKAKVKSPSPQAEAQARRDARRESAERKAENENRVQCLRKEAAARAEKCRPRLEGYFAALRSEIVIPESVLTLFKAPFVHDGHGYIRDADGETTASFSPVEPRGWGRIQYLDDGDSRFDAWVRVFAKLAGDARTQGDHDEVARRLAEHWFVAATRLAESKIEIVDEDDRLTFWKTMFRLLDGPRLSKETIVIDVVSARDTRRYDVEVAKSVAAARREPRTIQLRTKGGRS